MPSPFRIACSGEHHSSGAAAWPRCVKHHFLMDHNDATDTKPLLTNGLVTDGLEWVSLMS